jgi:hypothetical protein
MPVTLAAAEEAGLGREVTAKAEGAAGASLPLTEGGGG